MLFDAPIPKATSSIRTAFVRLVGKIRNEVENTLVLNPLNAALPRGTIVSYVQTWNGSHDVANQVRPTTDNTDFLVPPAARCNQQFVGVLETEAAAGSAANLTPAIARHGGGPVFVRLIGALDLHVGDAIWATSDHAQYGMGTNTTVALEPIYVGMVRDLGNYDALAANGTTGCNIIVKHQGPLILG